MRLPTTGILAFRDFSYEKIFSGLASDKREVSRDTPISIADKATKGRFLSAGRTKSFRIQVHAYSAKIVSYEM